MKRVAKYDPDTEELIAVFLSLKAAAESIFCGSASGICACCRRKLKTAYGYAWRYYEIPRGKDTPAVRDAGGEWIGGKEKK